MKPYIVHFHVLFAKTSGVCISKSYVFIQMGPPVSYFGSWVMHQCTHNLCCSKLFLSQISLVINFLSQFFISFFCHNVPHNFICHKTHLSLIYFLNLLTQCLPHIVVIFFMQKNLFSHVLFSTVFYNYWDLLV